MEEHWTPRPVQSTYPSLPSSIEDTIEYTSQQQTDKMAGFAPVAKMSNRQMPLATPPVSPYTTTHKSIEEGEPLSQSSSDPQLFPSPETASIATKSHVSLFTPSDSKTHDTRTSLPSPAPESTTARLPLAFPGVNVPLNFTKQDWLAAGILMKLFNADRRGYVKVMMQHNGKVRPRNLTKPIVSAPAPRPPLAPVHTGVKKTARAQTPVRSTPAPKSPKIPQRKIYEDFRSIDDYSPPLSTLDHLPPNAMDVKWNGSVQSLENDPNRHELRPAEISVAEHLRFSAAEYLFWKRKIMIAKVAKLREAQINPALRFTKTHAQGACKIDVNKASKLYEAFDKVGWLNDDWFLKHL